jgi:nucleoid-associated protein YgaU
MSLLVSLALLSGLLEGCRRINPPVKPTSQPASQPASQPTTTTAPASRPADIMHTVRGGETWGKIAAYYYGNDANYMKIVKANPELVTKWDADGEPVALPILHTGQVIKIPVLKKMRTTQPR